MKDFFISYNKADRQWAEWIAWQLEDASYSVVIQCWDFLPGSNFVLEMHEATKDAERTIGVLSPHFLASIFTKPEWSAAFVNDPTGKKRKLLLIRIQDCQPDGLLAAISYLDLVDLDEDAARKKILAAARDERLKPSSPPGFPGDRTASGGPRFPGALPPIWNVPHLRNRNFTGREPMLNGLHTALNPGQPDSWLQALSGLGGKGKTTLAREFAYRYQADYDLVWWVRAEEPASITMDYVCLAAALGLPKTDSPDQAVNAVKGWLGQNRKWLLIFDNAQDPDALNRFLPQGGGGHVLITSRNPNWGGLAKVLPVEVFEPAEAVDFIFRRTNQDDQASAEALARETGRLPLALEQAGAYIKESGIKLSDYLVRFRKNRAEILKRGKPTNYLDTVATTWNISFQAVRTKSMAGADLLVLCSFLAPDDIPRSMIAAGAEHFPEPLASAVAEELELDSAMTELRRYSLITGVGDNFSMHQLVQVVVRSWLTKDELKKWSAASLNLLNDAFQFDENSQKSWEECAPLLLHALACAGYAEVHGAASEIIAEILNNAGSYQRHFADFNEAKSSYERSLAIDEKAFGPEHTSVARDINNLGLVLQDLGDLAGAKSSFERALVIDEKALGPEHTSVARDVNNLGSVLQALGDLAGAKSSFERALAIDEKALGPEHTNVARDVNNLGSVLKDLGDLAGAKRCYERALAIDEKAFGSEHTSVATIANNLGLVLKDQGDLAGAKRCFERSLAIDEKAFGPEHTSVATDVNNLGLVRKALGDLAGAKRCFERALAIDEKAFGPEHTSVATIANNLGSVLKDLGDLAGAKSSFERSLAIDEKAFGPEHTSVAIRVNNLGLVLQALGDLAGAKSSFERSLAIDEKALGPEHTSVAIRVNNLGGVLQALGDLAGAKRCYERSLAIDEKALGPEHTSVARDVNNLGSVLQDLGDLAGAKRCYERSIRILQKFLGKDHPLTKKVKANLNALNSQKS